jgi:hypothetical protein
MRTYFLVLAAGLVLLAGCSQEEAKKSTKKSSKKKEVVLSYKDQPLDLSGYNLKPVYEADFSKPLRVIHEDKLFEKDAEGNMKRTRKVPKKYDWVLEGQTHLRTNNGRLEFHTYKEGTEFSSETKSHMVLWSVRDFPADFLLEFDVSPIDPTEGLAIIFFCAKGLEGESVFALNQPYRNGEFSRYNNGQIDCYHVSYWASDRGYSNLRKNAGKIIVASGKDHIRKSKPGQPVRIRLLKVGRDITLETDGKQALIWRDEQDYYGEGKIGLRSMGHSRIVSFGNFKVWEVKPK